MNKIKNKVGSLKTSQLKFQSIAILTIVTLFILFHLLSNGKFLRMSNLSAILDNSVSSAYLIYGFCFISSTGITDLSLGAIIIIASNIAGISAINLQMGYVGLVFGGIVTAVLLVSLNLNLLRLTKIPSWVLGIGMTMIYEGIASLYSEFMVNNGSQTVSLGSSYRLLGRQPYNIIILILGVLFAYFIFNRTSIGFGIKAVGSNREIASIMGINVEKVTMLAGIVGGIFLGIASVVGISYSSRVTPSTGLATIGTIFTAIAGFLLAQTLSKVFNLIIAILISSILVTTIYNVMTILGVPSGTWQEVVMGLIILISGIISNRKERGPVK